MVAEKVAVTIEAELLHAIDKRVASGQYRNRSKAVQAGLRRLLVREGESRLLAELAKLDPEEEHALAEEGYGA